MRPRARSLASKPALCLVACAALLVAAPTRADDASWVERAKNSLEAGRYDEAVERFRELLVPGGPRSLQDPRLVLRVRTYLAAGLLATERAAEAEVEIERVLREDPSFRPDPVELPGVLVDRFTEVRARLREELDARGAHADEHRAKAREAWVRYVADLERLAASEVVVTRRSRWVAAIPFGAGQLQNGDTALGYSLLATEAVLAAASVASAVSVQVSVAQQDDAHVDLDALGDRVRTARTVNLWSTTALLVVAVAGVVHAQATFVPEVRETRPRPVPKAPTLAPTLGMGAAHELSVGVTGAF